MLRSRWRLVDVGLALIFISGPQIAAGQAAELSPESARAREAFLEGQTAYEAGDYEEAAQLWEQAYEIDPRPTLQYNLAQAYGRLGRTVDEVAALERFLASTDPSNPFASDVDRRLARARERIARTSVRIINAPPGASITVDSEEHGETPRSEPIRVTPGSHRITLRHHHRPIYRATVVARAGITVEVDASTSETSFQEEDAGVPTVPLVLWISGGAVAIAGAVIGAVALAQSSDAVQGTPEANNAKALAIVSDVSIGVGVAAAAAGLVLFLLDGSEMEPSSDSMQVAALAGPNFAGLGLRGRL